MITYPIKFEPILQEKIWGGSKLKDLLLKKSTSDAIGESWEISGVEGHISVVNNGIYKGASITDLIKDHQQEFVGRKNYEQFGDEFPLLIKYLDAQTDLSVQVHPDDTMAREAHNSFGKTEMWYIMDREDDATIINGFKDKKVTTNSLRAITKDNVDQILNKQKVNKGDAFFIPAGKVHANSKVLASCPYFTSTVIKLDEPTTMDYTTKDSFVIYMCVEGSLEITINDATETVQKGETVLIPANATQVVLEPKDARILEVYIK